jgi:hypothetical protein
MISENNVCLLFAYLLFSPSAFSTGAFMCSSSTYAISCPEHARLESEFQEARDRMRNLLRLRQLTRLEERRLADQVAMTIARLKEHIAAHGCQRP